MIIVHAAVFAVIVAAVFWLISRRSKAAASRKMAAEASLGLRERLLRGSASEFDSMPESLPGGAWGCLMDMGRARACATLASLADGATSLYFSTGGGFLGAGEHDQIAAASKAFVAMAAETIASMEPTNEFPLPAAGRVRFYVLTSNGVFTAEAGDEDLAHNAHPLSPLWRKGQDVLTHVRLLAEQQPQQ